MELHLEEYTYEEFTEIVRRLLKKKYELPIELSEKSLVRYGIEWSLKILEMRSILRN